MNNIAQYITVFLANYTTKANDTPDCYADRRALCNNITCIMPNSGERYNFSFQACEEPVKFSIGHSALGDDRVVTETYDSSQDDIQIIKGLTGARLTLNHLDGGNVQLQVL